MIRITRDSTNYPIVTLTEKGSASYYLVEFQNKSSRAFTYGVCTDSSPHPERYNKLTIREVTTGVDPLIPRITLVEGEYIYRIFANSSSSNLDPTGLTELERGFALVTDTQATDTEYEITTTYGVYEG